MAAYAQGTGDDTIVGFASEGIKILVLLTSSIQLHLYYISASNHLSSRVFSNNGWDFGENLSSYTTSPNSRQLSITLISSNRTDAVNATANQSLLLYENQRGNVTALLRVVTAAGYFYWVDITSYNSANPSSDLSPIYYNVSQSQVFSTTLYPPNSPTKLRAPFVTAPFQQPNSPKIIVRMLICESDYRSIFWTDYYSFLNASHGLFSGSDNLRQKSEFRTSS